MMQGDLEKIISQKLASGEVVVELASTCLKQVKKSKYKAFTVIFWCVFLLSLAGVVFLSNEGDEPWLVGKFGKLIGFTIMLLAALWWFNILSFFQKSEPSQDRIKYYYFALTNSRVLCFSKKKKMKRDLLLNDIMKIDVFASRNKLTLYLDDPLEPTITLNGIRNPLKFAKAIDEILYGEFGLS